MPRRILTTMVVASAVSLSGVVLAPTASAAVTEPTAISATATPKKLLLKVKVPSQPSTTLEAAFDDPDNTIGIGQLTIVYPGGGKYGPSNATPVTIGNTKTFSRVYVPTIANPPGVYRVKFEALPKSGITYTERHVAKAEFTVIHQTKMSLVASPGSAKKGQKVKFYGSFYPHYKHVKGKKVILSYKKKGTDKFVKLATTRLTNTATFNFDKVKVTKSGKARVKFKGTKYYVDSRKTIKYTVY